MPSSKRGARSKKDRENKARYAVYIAFFIFLLVFFGSASLYSASIISMTQLTVYSSIALSMLFSFTVFAFMLGRGRSFKQMFEQLGLSRKTLTWRNILIGVALFFIILLLEVGLAAFEAATGIQLPTNVGELFNGLPLYFLVFSTFVAPFNEETLFRGFLIPTWLVKKGKRSGAWLAVAILLSSLFFGFLHYVSYNSISEFIIAFAFGIGAGILRVKLKSIYPSITAHILVNFVGLILLGA